MNTTAQRQISCGQPVFGGNEERYVLECLRSTRITQGAWVERFETEFAQYIGTQYAVAVSSGTAALHLALVALGIGPGDEVIIPALTFIATANAVAYTGATPVVVDVDPETWCIDPPALEAMIISSRAIGRRVKAIIPVHLYGAPAAMDSIRDIAKRYRLSVIEDAAEAVGAKCGDSMVGSIGDMGCFSFYGSKTITTGEGGMITTNNPTLYKQLCHLRGQGMTDKRYWHDAIGYNYRMTDLQAAIGVAQLEQVQTFLDARSIVFDSYYGRLHCDERFTFQKRYNADEHSAWAVAVKLSDYAKPIAASLALYGIETRPVFYPVNDMPMYEYGQRCNVAVDVSRHGLVLPTHAALTDDDVAYVCGKLIEVING